MRPTGDLDDILCTAWWKSFPTSLPDCLSNYKATASVVAELKDYAKTIFSIPADREVRLWNNYLNNTYESLARLKDESTLQDAGFYSGNTVVVEMKKEDGSWQREDNSTKS